MALLLCLAVVPKPALASDQVTQLWSYGTTRFGEHIQSLAISADGNYVVAATDYYTIYLFSSSSSTPLWSYTFTGGIACLSISADGRYIAAVSGGLYLFSREKNTPIWKADVWGSSVAISADGEYIATATLEYGYYWGMGYVKGYEVCLFSRSSSTPLWSYETAATYGYMSSVSYPTVSISSDGGYTVVSSAGTDYGGNYTSTDYYVDLISREGAPVWSQHTFAGYPGDSEGSISATISSDGDYVLVGERGNYNGVSLFSRLDNALLWTYASGEDVRSVTMSANGNCIAIGTGDSANRTGYVRLFSRTDNTPLWSYKTSSSDYSFGCGVYSVVISADGNYIAASEQFYSGGTSRHGLYLFSSSSGTPVWSSVPSYWNSPGTREVAGISSDGSRILVHNSSTDAIELYGRSAILPSTSLEVSPSNFSVLSSGTTALTATLTSGGTPLADKTITWTITAGSVDSLSGTTDSQGRVTITYTAPATEGSVAATASFAGDAQYAPSSGNANGAVTKTTTSPAGGAQSAFPWWILLVLYFVISAVLAAWVYRDSKDRKMKRKAWAGFTFLTSVVGLAVYLKLRKSGRGPKRPQSPGGSICSKCGAEIPSGTSFCPFCGEKQRGRWGG